jgi:hypothetical protein
LRATPLTTMAKPISLIRWCSGSMDRPRPRNLRRSDWLFVLDGLPPAVDAAVFLSAPDLDGQVSQVDELRLPWESRLLLGTGCGTQRSRSTSPSTDPVWPVTCRQR